MKIKRYDPIEVVGPDGDDVAMEERPDGQWYSRADLIDAGCLVPVPDGNRCLLRHVTADYVLADDGHIYQREDGDWWSLRDKFQFLVGVDMFVQPVRLVRLEDAG